MHTDTDNIRISAGIRGYGRIWIVFFKKLDGYGWIRIRCFKSADIHLKIPACGAMKVNFFAFGLPKFLKFSPAALKKKEIWLLNH